MIATDELKAALQTALDAALSVPVLEQVPPSTVAGQQYVVIGETTAAPDDTHGAHGSEVTVTLHQWQRSTSGQATKVLQRAIDLALHNTTLALSGGGTAFLRVELAETMRETAGGITDQHGIMRVRAFITEAP